MSYRKARRAGLAAFGLCGLISLGDASAAQYGLVIGIDDYQHGSLNPGVNQVRNLEGAVNDARALVEALRQAGVDVPEERLLLNQQATRVGVLDAWNAMVAAAQPGDTLVLTYSGHGGQEQEQPGLGPKDEADGLDETLMLYEFNPHPDKVLQGRISDDELTGLFRDASQYRIVFVADTCHAAGLYRGVRAAGHSRASGPWAVSPDASRPKEVIPTAADAEPLPHVTQLLANDNEALEIQEVFIDGARRGALSWGLTRALGGAAEQDHDGKLTRQELGDYLDQTVGSVTDRLQTPRVLPAVDPEPVLTIAKQLVAPAPTDPGPIQAQALGVTPPAGLKGVAWNSKGGDLAFEPAAKDGAVIVRNRVGDDLTSTLPAADSAAWQRVIDSTRLLRAIDAVNQTKSPVDISLAQGDGEHPLGEVLSFGITSSDTDLRALTLFNLSGNGKLDYLYPLADYKDPPEVNLPFRLPESKVTGPIGGENLVAVLCERPPEALQGLLARSARDASVPAPDVLLGAMAGQRCQIGRHPWFSVAE